MSVPESPMLQAALTQSADIAESDPRYNVERAEEELEADRRRNDLALKRKFSAIFEKYGQDFSSVGDEIDMETGQIVVDNGHLAGMAGERDIGGEDAGRFVRAFTAGLQDEDESRASGQTDSDSNSEFIDSEGEEEAVAMDEFATGDNALQDGAGDELEDTLIGEARPGKSENHGKRKRRRIEGPSKPVETVDLDDDVDEEDEIESFAQGIATQIGQFIRKLRKKDRGMSLGDDTLGAFGNSIQNALQSEVHLSPGYLRQRTATPGRSSLWALASSTPQPRYAQWKTNIRSPNAIKSSLLKRKQARFDKTNDEPQNHENISDNDTGEVEEIRGPDHGGPNTNAESRTATSKLQAPVSDNREGTDFLETGQFIAESVQNSNDRDVPRQGTPEVAPADLEIPSTSPLVADTPAHQKDAPVSMHAKEHFDPTVQQMYTTESLPSAKANDASERPVRSETIFEDILLLDNDNDDLAADMGIIESVEVGAAFTRSASVTSEADARKRKPYTPHDLENLLKLREEDELGWNEILAYFPGRSLNGIQNLYHRAKVFLIDPKDTNSHYARYSQDDLERIKDLRDNQSWTWEAVAKEFPGRTAAGIEYFYHKMRLKAEAAGEQGGFSSTLNNRRWTSKDLDEVVRLREVEGLSWKAITARFPGRSCNALQSMYQRTKGTPGAKTTGSSKADASLPDDSAIDLDNHHSQRQKRQASARASRASCTSVDPAKRPDHLQQNISEISGGNQAVLNSNQQRIRRDETVVSVRPDTPVHESDATPSEFAAPSAETAQSQYPPKCARCREKKKACDRQRPCGLCKQHGIGYDGCIPQVIKTSSAKPRVTRPGSKIETRMDIVRKGKTPINFAIAPRAESTAAISLSTPHSTTSVALQSPTIIQTSPSVTPGNRDATAGTDYDHDFPLDPVLQGEGAQPLASVPQNISVLHSASLDDVDMPIKHEIFEGEMFVV